MTSHVTAFPSHVPKRGNDFETSRGTCECEKETIGARERMCERETEMRKCLNKRKGDDNGCQR